MRRDVSLRYPFQAHFFISIISIISLVFKGLRVATEIMYIEFRSILLNMLDLTDMAVSSAVLKEEALSVSTPMRKLPANIVR